MWAVTGTGCGQKQEINLDWPSCPHIIVLHDIHLLATYNSNYWGKAS